MDNRVAMWEQYRLQNRDRDKRRVRRNATKEKACEQLSSRARPPPGSYSEEAEVVDLEPGNNDPLMDCGSFDLLFSDSNYHISKEPSIEPVVFRQPTPVVTQSTSISQQMVDAAVSTSVEASFSKWFQKVEERLASQVGERIDQCNAATVREMEALKSDLNRRVDIYAEKIFTKTNMLEESLSRTQRELNLAKTHWEYRFEGRTPPSGAFVDIAAAEEEPRPPPPCSSSISFVITSAIILIIAVSTASFKF